MHDTVTAKDIAEALGVTERSAQRRATKEGWAIAGRSGLGGAKAFVKSSLPEPVRIALDRHFSLARPALGIIQGGKAAITAATPATACLPTPLATASPEPALPPAALSKAALKADLVKAYLEAKAWGRKHGKSMAQCREAFVLGYNAGRFCPSIREHLGETSWKTLERWALELRRADYDCAAIAPRYGLKRQGLCKVTEVEEERLLFLLLSQNQFKIGTAITAMKMDMEMHGLESPSSPSTLRNWVEGWKKEHIDVWTLARKGKKALDDEVAPFFRRDWSLLEVGQLLIADGHRLNFRIKHPVHGRPCRASLIAFQDGASRDIAGYTFMLEEDIASIHLALYRSILRLRKIPEAVLLDNGKAFKAKLFTDEGPDFTEFGMSGLYSRLGIQCHFAKPYNSRSKMIEPFWKTLGLSYEKAFSSYCGGSIESKPARMKRNEKFMQSLEPEVLVTMEQASQLFESWLNTYYRVKPHSGLGGKCPGEVFAAGRGQGVEHSRLRYLMMSEEVATIRHSVITVLGGEYENNKALYGLSDRVVIRYDMQDFRAIWVYRLNGEFLCQATRRVKTHPMFGLIGGKDAEGYAEYKAQAAEHASLKRDTRRVVKQLSRAGKIAQARDILSAPEMVADPRFADELERIAAQNTPPEQGPPLIEENFDDVPASAGPGRLIDPTRIDWLDDDELALTQGGTGK